MGAACANIYFDTGGAPVCMDECPSQSAVVHIQGKVTCLTNMEGGACHNIGYTSQKRAVCLDGRDGEYSSQFSVTILNFDELQTEMELDSIDVDIDITEEPLSPELSPSEAGTVAPKIALRTPSPALKKKSDCNGDYDILKSKPGEAAVCIHCTAEAYVWLNGTMDCLMNSVGAPCVNTIFDTGTPKCFDECPDQKAVVYIRGHPICLLNDKGSACVHILSVSGTPTCFDSCPDEQDIVYTFGKPECVLNEEGGACEHIIRELWGWGKPICADKCVKVTYSWGRPECLLPNGETVPL